MRWGPSLAPIYNPGRLFLPFLRDLTPFQGSRDGPIVRCARQVRTDMKDRSTLRSRTGKSPECAWHRRKIGMVPLREQAGDPDRAEVTPPGNARRPALAAVGNAASARPIKTAQALRVATCPAVAPARSPVCY
jgi:hypothetical protein